MVFFAVFAGMFQSPVHTIEQDVLKSYLEKGAPFDFILIDVCGGDEISAAIGNAGCKPYNLEWPTPFKEISGKIPKDRAIIVYCQSGGRAARAASYLSESGYSHVYNAGGFLTWKGPTVPPSEIKPAALLPEPSCKSRQWPAEWQTGTLPFSPV
jgi:rhodanese-related sulfurtransferase